eukprot:4161540-Ditylum_brightwellii.AAC.1
MTAYQPCKVTKDTGTTTYHQQLAIQQSNTTIKVNPQKSFTQDLTKWMVTGHHKGEQYILAGDFNKPLHSTSGTIKLCSNKTPQLVDILASMNATKFSTAKTREERINYILIIS